MRFVAAILVSIALFTAAHPALADINQVEAREVARINNCTPKKISVFQQSLGTEGTTVYRVDCNMPKTDDANAAKGADALLVSCKDNLCELLRPLASESK